MAYHSTSDENDVEDLDPQLRQDQRDEDEDEDDLDDLNTKLDNDSTSDSTSDSESDSESESDIDEDEDLDVHVPDNSVTDRICGTTPEFCNDVHELKYKIYEIIVLSPKDEESLAAQDTTVLQNYVTALDTIYRAALEKVNNNTTIFPDKTALQKKGYSDQSIDAIYSTINHVNNYVTTNSNLNKIAYLSYISNQFHFFPYFHLPSFPN